MNSALQIMHVDDAPLVPSVEGEKEKAEGEKKDNRAGTYKKWPRQAAKKGSMPPIGPVEKKRSLEDMMDGIDGKKLKFVAHSDEAGMLEQPCKDQ